MDSDIISDRNKTEYTDEEVAKGKIKGLQMLDQFEVYDVVDEQATTGKQFVDTKWEISWRAGELKCRLVGASSSGASTATTRSLQSPRHWFRGSWTSWR